MAITPIINKPIAGQAPAIKPVVPITPVAQAPVSSVHDNVNLGNSTETQNQAILAQNQAKRQEMAQAGEIPAVGEQATPAQTYTPPTPVIKQNNPITTQQATTPVAPVVGAPIVPKTTAPVTPPASVRPPSQSVIQGQSPIDGKTMEERLANITASYDEGFKAYDNQILDYKKKADIEQKIVDDPTKTANEKALAQQNLNAYNEASQIAKINRTKAEENLNTELNNEKDLSLKEEMDARNKNAFLRDYETQKARLEEDQKRETDRLAKQGQQQIDDQARQNQKDATSLQILGNAVIGGGHMGGQDSGIAQGIADELNYGKTLLDRVITSVDWQMTDLVEEFNRSNTDLHNKYVDSIPQATQDLLTSISSLDQAGRLKTIQDWEAAKRSLAPIINKIQVAQTAKLDAIKSNNALFEKQLEQLKNTKKVDNNASEANGYFMNSNGEPMLGQDGKPMIYQSNAIASSSMNEKTGELTILYKDGRYKTQKVQNPSLTQEWKESTTMPGYVYNPQTGEYKQAGTGGLGGGTGYSSPAPTVETVKSISPRLQGNDVQCGMVSNDWMSKYFPNATRMGDSYESKVASIQSIGVSQTPQVGGVFVMKVMGSPNGHTGIVQSVSPDGKYVTVTDANKKDSVAGGPVETSTYPVTSNMTFSLGTQPQQSEQTFSPQATDWGQNILGGTAKFTDVPKALKTEVSSYIAATNKTKQNTNVAQLKSTLKLVDTLINHPGREATTGASSMFPTWPGGDSAGFQAKLEQLTAANFMQGIKSMKGYGSLSDAEGSKVGASISSLSKLNQSDEEFKTELERLKGVLQNSLISTEKETGIKYDDNGFAVAQGQPESTTTAPEQPKTTVSQADIDAAKAQAKALLNQ